MALVLVSTVVLEVGFRTVTPHLADMYVKMVITPLATAHDTQSWKWSVLEAAACGMVVYLKSIAMVR